MSTLHTVEILQLRSGAWGGTCTCGWVPPMSPRHDDVLRAARGHAEDVEIVEAPSTASHGVRRHERLRAELIRQAGDALLFRSICSCGWRSEPVTMGRVVLVWDRHVDDEESKPD